MDYVFLSLISCFSKVQIPFSPPTKRSGFFHSFLLVSKVYKGIRTGGNRQLMSLFLFLFSCRQTVDTHCLPHRRDSKACLAERIPFSLIYYHNSFFCCFKKGNKNNVIFNKNLLAIIRD